MGIAFLLQTFMYGIEPASPGPVFLTSRSSIAFTSAEAEPRMFEDIAPEPCDVSGLGDD